MWCVVCALAIGLASNVFGQTCGAGTSPALYNESFTIEKQAGSVRYVDRAVMTNSARGDYYLEFMADRTDLSDTRERWTITYENNESYDFVQHVDVDGDWVYSVMTATVNGTRVLTLSVPGQSTEIGLDDPCNDPDFGAFLGVADQISTNLEVVNAVVEEMQWTPPDSDMQEYLNCTDNCGNLPDCTEHIQEPEEQWCVSGCVDLYLCRLSQIDHQQCVGNCRCTWIAPDVETCCAELQASLAQEHTEAIQELISCLSLAGPCPCQ